MAGCSCGGGFTGRANLRVRRWPLQVFRWLRRRGRTVVRPAGWCRLQALGNTRIGMDLDEYLDAAGWPAAEDVLVMVASVEAVAAGGGLDVSEVTVADGPTPPG